MNEQTILQTLAYFAVFSQPLTAEELYYYLWQKPNVSFEKFLDELSELVAKGVLIKKYGYYQGAHQSNLVENRRRAVPYVETCIRRAVRAAKIIAWLPFIQAIFLCNSVAAENADASSDIDFFIVTKSDRAWTVRLATVLLLHLSGLRRHGRHVAGRVCLSFYVDEEHLDFSKLRIENDVYLAYWIRQLLPVYDSASVYEKLVRSNDWQSKLLLSRSKAAMVPAVTVGWFAQRIKNMLEWLFRGAVGTVFEQFVRYIQRQKISRSHKEYKRQVASAVVVEDGVLKFHETDARERIRSEWFAVQKSYGI